MAPLEPSRLLCVPNELLYIIIDFLCEPNLVPPRCEEERKSPTAYSIRHIRPLSLVSHQLRSLCLAPLFASLEFASAKPKHLRALETKCIDDTKFAGLIRKLKLGKYVRSPSVLLSLLSCLQSLDWLDTSSRQVDADLLAAANRHPSLKTVALPDCLFELLPLASMSLSKILILLVLSDCALTLQSPALHSLVSRVPRLARLVLRDPTNIKNGPGALLVSGLEFLDIKISSWPTSPMSWLPAFVDRHKSLEIIKFTGDQYGLSWTHNPDILFPLRFIDALDREDLERVVALNTFSIYRNGRASIDAWQVIELELTIEKPAGLAALSIATSLAPRLSSLIFCMPPHDKRPVHIDDLLSALACFPSLRRLDLRYVYPNLRWEGPAPWALPPSDMGQLVSGCMVAHAALHWITSRIAERTSTLELVHLFDEGFDGKGCLVHQWTFGATYQVRRSFGAVEIHGTPRMDMASRFTRPQKSRNCTPCP
ncbi:hypothetical protein B0H15DRAFT_839400 [Mycena belliarum]|uniref:F-box domain-containing protein n=1 Tax=Mycena belliarum TaxID=1033014 RepID=A0AAD6U942_9AGAR|nr:hypothetical protein B0H15DRAFT_839400 [Mycena belliae]